ncbi:hypothetical protein [Rhodohalobacter mucosus]|uniref:Uncharacterized protein n=1 Tax=Rhodohalobacter mucosus TaxID=2079485 RepID=A0A316TP22_9BACT|nr:hypothetical protein [Rhodohalobacter mucosus]PWN06363.1 hypothetical protein DDZ15_11115 [Rhodohalobacter mucosus]
MENKNLLESIEETDKILKYLKEPVMRSLYSLEEQQTEFLHQLYFEGSNNAELIDTFEVSNSEAATELRDTCLEHLSGILQSEHNISLTENKLKTLLHFYGEEFRKERQDALKNFMAKKSPSIYEGESVDLELDPEYRDQLIEADSQDELFILLVTLLSAMYVRGLSIWNPILKRNISKIGEGNKDEQSNLFTNIVLQALNEEENYPVSFILPNNDFEIKMHFDTVDKSIEFSAIKKDENESLKSLTITFHKEGASGKTFKMVNDKIRIPSEDLIVLIKEGYTPEFLFS